MSTQASGTHPATRPAERVRRGYGADTERKPRPRPPIEGGSSSSRRRRLRPPPSGGREPSERPPVSPRARRAPASLHALGLGRPRPSGVSPRGRPRPLGLRPTPTTARDTDTARAQKPISKPTTTPTTARARDTARAPKHPNQSPSPPIFFLLRGNFPQTPFLASKREQKKNGQNSPFSKKKKIPIVPRKYSTKPKYCNHLEQCHADLRQILGAWVGDI